MQSLRYLELTRQLYDVKNLTLSVLVVPPFPYSPTPEVSPHHGVLGDSPSIPPHWEREKGEEISSWKLGLLSNVQKM